MNPPKILLERIEKWLSPIYWTDTNIHSSLYPLHIPVTSLTVHEPPNTQRPSFQNIISHHFRDTHIGESFGPSWSTKWFRFQVHVPMNLQGECIALKWDSNSEAMLYNANGEPIQAFTGGGGSDRRDLCILEYSATAGDSKTYFVEMACNEMFGNGQNGMIMPPGENKRFTLSTVEVVVVNQPAMQLYWDMTFLYDLVKSLPSDSATGAHATSVMTEVLNSIDLSCTESISSAHKRLQGILADSSSCKIDHDVYAFGHCHIDTAWLWPYEETRRKVARSWVTQLKLMERYPDHRFVASQTVQYEWLAEDQPDIFQRIRNAVVEGRFVPIGGTYVEFDANIPSGESMIRQFLYGMRYLDAQFGVRPEVFWLPDTFGYSSQLPQIMKGFGIKYFLSQKLSWNLINTFPHNTFEWEGIDGSSVLAHFPPADNYNSEANPSDIVKTVSNNKSKMTSNRSMLLFGHGDGGGGPAVSHLEKLNRCVNCPALPRLHLSSTPDDFFHKIEEDLNLGEQCFTTSRRPVPHSKWIGELYLELHQGTLTTNANIKARNRLCEYRLRAVEAIHSLCTICAQLGMFSNGEVDFLQVTRDELTARWKDTLLNQFHDVLPGTSIAKVYEDSDNIHVRVLATCDDLLQKMSRMLLRFLVDDNSGDAVPSKKRSHSQTQYEEKGEAWVFNPCAVGRQMYGLNRTGSCGMTNIPGFSYSKLVSFTPGYLNIQNNQTDALECTYAEKRPDGLFMLRNELVEAIVSEHGQILSFVDKRCHPPREVIQQHGKPKSGLANNFVLYDDIPFFWDAWDVMPYHLMTGKSINGIDCGGKHKVAVVSEDCVASLRFQLTGWGENSQTDIEFTMTLSANSPMIVFDVNVNWHERHKLLKVEFPLAIRSSVFRCETQFGYTERPTHSNTSTDAAMFEVCGHRFASLSESGYGVALLNNSKYGYSCRGSTLCLSLLRSPKSPDPNADMGRHSFSYALLPHKESFLSTSSGLEVLQFATAFNSPPIQVEASRTNDPTPYVPSCVKRMLKEGLFYLSSSGDTLVLESMKVAERRNETFRENDVVLRLYEAMGCRGAAQVSCRIPIGRVEICTLDEVPIRDITDSMLNHLDDASFVVDYTPFSIVTLRISFSKKQAT